MKKAGEFTWGNMLHPTSHQERQFALLWETYKLISLLVLELLVLFEHKLTINPKKCHGKRSFQKTSPKTVFANPRMSD